MTCVEGIVFVEYIYNQLFNQLCVCTCTVDVILS